MSWILKSDWLAYSIVERSSGFWFTMDEPPTKYPTEEKALKALARFKATCHPEHNVWVEELEGETK